MRYGQMTSPVFENAITGGLRGHNTLPIMNDDHSRSRVRARPAPPLPKTCTGLGTARLSVLLGGMFACAAVAQTGTGWGSLNNFDTVNETGQECHGFEIELEDLHSTDITHTYNWNHYGVPEISEDNSDPAHPRVFVRYRSAKNPDGTWAAYTAVPTGPISPTQGHQFTNPSVNFGGEHFGVGYRGVPSAVIYHWLLDDGAGNLVLGPAVNIATPIFTYQPGAGGGVAQVQAAIVPPPAPPVKEFGPAGWVKEIRTESHNNNEVKLRDLVSDDPDDPNDRNWRNNEPDEVEVEWQLLQEEFGKADGGGNGELKGAPEDLPGGDEVITRRYEFYAYTGPIDAETGEAMTDKVGPDGIHGVGTKIINDVEVDLATVEIVGDFLGAQMSAFDANASVGLIDHLQDGEVGVEYPARTLVIAGVLPFNASSEGDLPDGMSFDPVTGVLSGTPAVSGEFRFKVNASDEATAEIQREFTLTIAEAGVEMPPRSVIETTASPAGAGSTLGSGVYQNGDNIGVEAIPNAGFGFANWTENGKVVSTSALYEFSTEVNRALIAHFVPRPALDFAVPAPGTLTLSWPATMEGWTLQESPDPEPTHWTDSIRPVETTGDRHQVGVSPLTGGRFFRLVHP
ncbi:MAG: putative Ig domain-containing protein [Verrucomicrobiales bacterium]|nr:putative Ig domain-containing protein [Verrucomicrobiales bacterium]